MIHSTPGIKSYYPSSMCSPWHCWFIEMGYPNLDIVEHYDNYWLDSENVLYGPTGNWSIIEYYHTPMIPSEAHWNYVLMDIRHQPITPGFIETWVKKLDLHRKQVWEEADLKTKKMEKEKEALELHAQDTAERAKNFIMQTPTAVERIAKNGLKEMNISNIIKHVPKHQLIGYKGPKV